MKIKKVESDKNKLIKWIQLLMTKSRERKKQELYVVEGFKAINELDLKRIHTLIVADQVFLKNWNFTEGLESQTNKTQVIEVSMNLFKKISQDKTPQGIMAIVHIPKVTNIEEVFEREGLYLALDNIQDPGNLGTMIRVCDAVNASGLLISKDSVDPYHPKVTKGSMGSIERVDIHIVDNLGNTLEKMNHLGIETIGAYLEESQYHFNYQYTNGTCFVIGNEGKGISDEVINRCSKRVKIPMPGGSESLNAGVAASVLLYEALRQRMD